MVLHAGLKPLDGGELTGNELSILLLAKGYLRPSQRLADLINPPCRIFASLCRSRLRASNVLSVFATVMSRQLERPEKSDD
jgi:hypothetical protein